VEISAQETANYLAVSENVALVIENKYFDGITLSGAAFTYDGSLKSLAITGTLPQGATLVFAGNEKTDIGTYPVNALIQKTNYNDLWLSATMEINAPVPVCWISFVGKIDDSNHAQLDWTVDQSSVFNYQIERSHNAKDFRMVGEFIAISYGVNQYSFIDTVAVAGTVYYRIRQTDLDGSYSYSRIISLTGTEGAPLMAYPNPVSDWLVVRLGAEYVGKRLILVNATGIVVHTLTATKSDFMLSMGSYLAGTYILYTWDGRAVKIIKN
jgi:hypothetical protein